MRSWTRLKWIHLLVGIAGLLMFLATGMFMDRRLDHLAGMADAPRALYRSAHSYILFSALLHFVLGVYLVRPASLALRVVQYLGSALLLASLAYFCVSFFVETPLGLLERPMIRRGIMWSLGGVLLHGAAGLLPAGRGAVPSALHEPEPESHP